ncbi:hypothetical protein Dimus_027091, partial [Dionaea muscipula]
AARVNDDHATCTLAHDAVAYSLYLSRAVSAATLQTIASCARELTLPRIAKLDGPLPLRILLLETRCSGCSLCRFLMRCSKPLFLLDDEPLGAASHCTPLESSRRNSKI